MSLSPAGHAESATPRRAGPGDAVAVADLLIRARTAAAGAIPAMVHTPDEVHQWVRFTVIAEREVWLMDDGGGKPLGVLVLDADWIDQLYVDPDVTGAGLGSRFVELAKARRPERLQLWTFQSNTGAQRFYRRHGFVEAERTDGSGNEEKAPDVRFTWQPAG
jgi:GNAT superfamily N-acetyltransferase